VQLRSPFLSLVLRGAAAGVAGTAVMTGYQYLVQGSDGQANGKPHVWKDAPAPAQVGKRVLALFDKKVTLDDVPWLTSVFHWGYGIGWGAIYGAAVGDQRAGTLQRSLLFGTTVWAASYAELVPMGIYEPPWKYSPQVLGTDLSYHLVYGISTGIAFALLGEGAS
jgi:hypothetical protein